MDILKNKKMIIIISVVIVLIILILIIFSNKGEKIELECKNVEINGGLTFEESVKIYKKGKKRICDEEVRIKSPGEGKELLDIYKSFTDEKLAQYKGIDGFSFYSKSTDEEFVYSISVDTSILDDNEDLSELFGSANSEIDVFKLELEESGYVCEN